MKKFVNKIAYVLAIAILFTSIQFPMVAKAADSFAITEDAYSEIMSKADGGKYFITSQPASALRLDNVIELSEDMLSPNYDYGVIDLPRLCSSYYYAFSGTQSAFYLGDTVYPTLCWTDMAKGQSATLCIYERNTNSVMFSCTIINRDLPGVTMKDFSDTSSGVLTSLLDAKQDAREYRQMITIYDPAMHKDSIVMPAYAYTPDKDYAGVDSAAYSDFDVAFNSYAFKRMVMTPSGVTTHYNIKDYLEYYARSPRSAVLFAGSKFDDCSFNGNTGEVTTKVTSSDIDELYFFIAVNDKCYFSVVMLDSIPNEDELVNTDPNAATIEWISSNKYSVLYDPDDNPDYPDFGPVSYDEWFAYAAKNHNVDLQSGKYGYTYHGDTTQNGVNLYARALMYAGIAPHVATLDLKKRPTQVSIDYMVMGPDDTKYNLVKSESFDAETFNFSQLLKLNKIDNYEPVEWCIDPECTKPFETNAQLDTTKNSKYTLYSTYKWAGGKYSVTYYNDATNVQTTQTYNLDEKPVLPNTPEAQPGYGFRNWYIVESVTSTDGVPYVATDFTPQENVTYLFKTMWDVKGVITQVLTSKLTYYVGEKVNKDLLDVYVRYNNEGDTRILESSEFELEEETISKAGVNQFWVVYPATNARGMCEITGLTVAPMSLDATYLGGDVMVGTELKTGDFRVSLTYNNGNTEVINNFSISPSQITQIGENAVTISYGDLKTTIKVKGISKDNPTGEEVTGLTVQWVGSTPYIDDKVDGKSLLVVATYGGSRNVTLYASQYQFSPDKFTAKGKQRITVVFGGKSASCDVDVAEKQAQTSGGNNNNNQQTTQKPNNPTTTTTKPNNTTTNNSNKNNNTTTSTSNKNNNTTTNKDKDKDKDKDTTASNDPLGWGALFGQDVTTPKDGLGTSIGYMHGSNIFTNVMSTGGGDAVISEVDIKQLIEEAGDNVSSLTITLVNGASGNDITPEMLKMLQDKTLSLYVNMVSPVNNDIVVGRWIIVGGQLDNTEVTLNPNISFETIDKSDDRLHMISLQNITYPKGVSVTAYPAVETYGTAQLVRLYSCTVTRERALILKTFPWQDTSNAIELDPYASLYYCLSDAMEAYPDGSDLNTNLSEVSINDPTDTETPQEPEDEGPGDDFWDTPEQPEIPTKKGIPTFLFIILGIAGLLLLLLIILMIILVSRKRKGRVKDDDDLDDYDAEDMSDVSMESDESYDNGDLRSSEDDEDDFEE